MKKTTKRLITRTLAVAMVLISVLAFGVSAAEVASGTAGDVS